MGYIDNTCIKLNHNYDLLPKAKKQDSKDNIKK